MLLFFEMSDNMLIVIVCFPGCDVMNFGIYLSFLIKPFSYMNKSQDKNLNTSRMKIAFQMK